MKKAGSASTIIPDPKKRLMVDEAKGKVHVTNVKEKEGERERQREGHEEREEGRESEREGEGDRKEEEKKVIKYIEETCDLLAYFSYRLGY